MSISIGKHIYAKLGANEELKRLVEDKFFAISTKTSTTFPFIAFKRSGLVPNYTKDRYATGDNVTVEIIVASNNYLESVDVAEAVRIALENKRGKYDTFNVIDAKVASSDEDFIEDTFIQRIVFSFETESN